MKNYQFRLVAVGLATALVLTLMLGRAPQISQAVEVPEPGPLQIQTSGPNTPLNIGDWYTQVAGDNTYHLLTIPVPDTYPPTQDITIQLFDPECYNAYGYIAPDPAAPGDYVYDEVRDAADGRSDDPADADTTLFRLLAPDGVTVVQETTYPNSATPVTDSDQRWVDFAVFNTGTYGAGNYELRITTADNDDNTWRIRVEPDDPDGIPNGNEIGTPFMRITYQFDPPFSPPAIPEFTSYDHTFWFYVPTDWPDPTITIHNFDFDYGTELMAGDASLTYIPPSGIEHLGTLSGNMGWNDGVADGGASPDRAGDTVPTEPGWWQIQLQGCYNNNQILVEVDGIPIYTDRPDHLAADVGLTKVRTTPSPVPVGETVSFDVTLTNTGLTAITTLPLEDTYDPTYLAFQSASVVPDFVDPTTGTLRWDNLAPAVGLVPGQSVTVTLNFTALASTGEEPGGVTVNTATSSGAVDDNGHTLTDQTASDDVAIVAADFTLNKVLTSDSPAVIGDTVSFSVEIVNTGETALIEIPLEDTYDPTYLGYVSASPEPDSVDETAGTLGWDNLVSSGSLAPGESIVVTLNFTALASTGEGVTTNTATVSGATDEYEQELPDQTDSADVAITTPPVIGLSKERTTASPVLVGEAVSFDITVVNNGETAILVLPLEDTYDPTYLDYVSASPEPDSVDETTGTLSWDNLVSSGPLAPGGSIVVTLNFTALASTGEGVTTNTATVSGAIDEYEQELPDQTDSADVAITEEPVPTLVDPHITKSGDPSQARIGDAVTFTLVARNEGNTEATGVVVTDQIESYLDITGVTSTKGTVTWDNVSRLVTVDIGTLAPTEEVTITIETVVNETATPAPLLIENQAHLEFNEGEQRDSETVIVEIVEEALEVTPTPTPEEPSAAGPPPEIPEPMTLLLLGGGLASLAGYATFRRRTS
ncbi:MAG: DUF11 domain-containing protein [Anaerolineae bacterium]|nr:DUF11 domain-containing protein [Anaerolineae bacterium]